MLSSGQLAKQVRQAVLGGGAELRRARLEEGLAFSVATLIELRHFSLCKSQRLGAWLQAVAPGKKMDKQQWAIKATKEVALQALCSQGLPATFLRS